MPVLEGSRAPAGREFPTDPRVVARRLSRRARRTRAPATAKRVRTVNRVYPSIEREVEFFDWSERRDARRMNLRAQLEADPSVVRRAISTTRAYPWLRPGVVSSLARTGFDVDSPVTARAALLGARQAARAGDFHSQTEPIARTARGVGHWLRQAASTVGELAATLEPTQALGRDVSNIARRVFDGQQAEPAQAGIPRQFDPFENTKMVSRAMFTVLNAPIQEAAREVGERIGGVPAPGVDRARMGARSELRQVLETPELGANPLQRYTTAIQSSTGRGFFTGGPVHERYVGERNTMMLPDLAAHEAEALNGLPGENAGTWASPGRLLTRHVFEPGSGPFNTASGMADAVFSIVTDPTSFTAPKGPITRVSQVGETVGAPASREGLRRIFGAFSSAEDTVGDVDAEIVQRLASKPGRVATELFTKDDSMLDLWERTGGKLGARTTLRLTEATDENAVVGILHERLRTGRTQEYPFVRPSLVQDRVRPALDGVRLLQTVPSHSINADDLDDAVTQIIRSGFNGQLPRDKIEATIRSAARVEPGDNVTLAWDVVRPHYADLVDEMLGHGSTREEADRIAGRIFEGYSPEDRAFALDELGNDMDFPGARAHRNIQGQETAEPSPHALFELVQGSVPLPDFREVRRATALPGVRQLLRNRKGLPQWVARGAVDVAATTMSQVVNPALLLRAAWLNRLIPDLQMRAAFDGLDSLASHPGAWATWAISAKPSRLTRWMAASGKEIDQLPLRAEEKLRGGLARFGLAGRGEQFNDEALRTLDEDMRAVATRQKDWYLGRGKPGPADRDVQRYDIPLDADDAVYTRAANDWADELRDLTRDEAHRNAASLPADDNRAWFSGPGGLRNRRMLATAAQERTLTDDEVARYGVATFVEGIMGHRGFMDDYAASHWRRVQARSGGSPEVIQAIGSRKIQLPGATAKRLADSKLVDADGFLDFSEIDDMASAEGRAFQAWARERIETGEAPAWFKGPRFEGGALAPRIGDRYNRALNWAFENLFTRGDQAINRNPALLQIYWQRMDEMVPFMDAATRAGVAREARANHLGRRYIAQFEQRAKTAGVPADAPLTDLTLVRDIARKQAYDRVQGLMYDQAKKHQFADIARVMAPFSEPLIEALTLWPKLAARNPRMLRRTQQVVQGAKGAGIFYTSPYSDEENQELMFAYPIPGLAAALGMEGNVNARFTGRVGGLQTVLPGVGAPGMEESSLGFIGGLLPGVGPVVQIPAAKLIPDTPGMEWLNDYLFPYGRPDPTRDPLGQLAELATPAWAVNASTFFTQTPDAERAYGNALMEVTKALVASGEYIDPRSGAVAIEGMSQDQAIAKLEADAKERARIYFGITAFSRFTLPTGGQITFGTHDADGRYHILAALSKQLDEMREEFDYDEGSQEFLATFGPTIFAAVGSKTMGSEMEALSKPGQRWEQRNPDLVRDYPAVRSFFAPGEDEPLDLDAFYAQFGRDVRDAKTPQQYARLQNRALGQMAADGERRKLFEAGIEPDSEEGQAHMSEVNRILEETYPGYGYQVATPGRPETWTTEDRMKELERAVSDPRLLNNANPTTRKVAGLLVQYMDVRRQLNERAVSEYGDEGTIERRGVKSVMNSKATRHYRDYLREVADLMIDDTPAFGPLWERVLERELADDRYRIE